MTIIRLLHILFSFWFVCGMLGRWLAYAQARRAAELPVASALLRLSDRFEQLMVIPGSQIVLLLGLGTAWLQGLPLLGALQGAGRVNWVFVSLVLYVSLIPLIVVVLAPRRRRRHALLAEAHAADTITPELRGALDDRLVRTSRALELLIVGLILLLMVLKPF